MPVARLFAIVSFCSGLIVDSCPIITIAATPASMSVASTEYASREPPMREAEPSDRGACMTAAELHDPLRHAIALPNIGRGTISAASA